MLITEPNQAFSCNGRTRSTTIVAFSLLILNTEVFNGRRGEELLFETWNPHISTIY